jgi:opacity protein-like surface antigen
MRPIGKSFVRLALLVALAIPTYASAQVSEDTDPEERTTPSSSEPRPEGELPPVRSGNDPQPPPASPLPPHGTVVKQAGVGGPVAYGRAGVLELGGAASFTTGSDFTQLSLRPSIGWFIANNLQLSGILSLNYADVAGTSATSWALLAEPSYHLPLSSTMFAFLGVGAGISHVSAGTGFALAPRLGMNFLIGRSGILTPALIAQYSTTEMVETPQGTLVAVAATFGMSIGYTVMW